MENPYWRMLKWLRTSLIKESREGKELITIAFNDGTTKYISECNCIELIYNNTCLLFKHIKEDKTHWIMLAVVPIRSIKYIENDSPAVLEFLNSDKEIKYEENS